jgi:hypothetical protein
MSKITNAADEAAEAAVKSVAETMARRAATAKLESLVSGKAMPFDDFGEMLMQSNEGSDVIIQQCFACEDGWVVVYTADNETLHQQRLAHIPNGYPRPKNEIVLSTKVKRGGK